MSGSGLGIAVSRGEVVDNYIIGLGSGENQMSELKLKRPNLMSESTSVVEHSHVV